jgi:hypothetical protein
VLSLSLALLCGGSAAAQNFGGPSSLAGRGNSGPAPTPPPPDPTPPGLLVTRGDPWPRLDPGAVLCRSPEDLARFNALRQARLSGQALPAEGKIDCSVIQATTPVTIVTREGLARTEVKLAKGDGQTGWTDIYLPTRAPATP